MDKPDHEQECPACHLAVGDHTIRGWEECLKARGLQYNLPFEDVGGIIWQEPSDKDFMAGEMTVGAAFLNTDTMGRVPCLIFRFAGPGADGISRVQTPPVHLVMDAPSMKNVRNLISQAVDRAILAARRGR